MNRLLVPFAALLAMGCAPTVIPEKEANGKSPVKPATQETPPSIPTTIKHDGYLYSGLDKLGQQTFLVKIGDQPESESVQTTNIQSSDSGSLTLERTRDGALAAVGSDAVKVDDKGVSVVSVSIGKLLKPSLELPADLSIGKTWQSASTIETGTETIKNSGSYKVVGDGPLKVAAGSFTARKVTFTGTIETSKGRGKVVGTYWFVKGLGAVKTEMTQTMPGQEPQTFILELKK